MNCSFCKQPCTVDHNYDGGEVWICKNHPYVVKEFINFTYHIKGDCYDRNCCPKRHHTSTVIYHDKFVAKFYRHPVLSFHLVEAGTGNRVFRLSFHPDLTPENIKQKLPLWVTFS